MPKFSVNGFLSFLRLRMIMAMKGDGIISKIRLFLWAIFASVPRTFRRRLSSLNRYVNYMENRLSNNVVINFRWGKFLCMDSESILILSYEFERWMWDYLNLDKGAVFVDVGAHIGKYTVPVAKIVGRNSLVIACEPHPKNYQILMENIRLNDLKNVIALNIAAWKKESDIKLFIGDCCVHHSVKKNFGLGFVTVQARPLDCVLQELEVENVDFIKIDVEGAEVEVLNGLIDTLKKWRPTLIIEITRELDKIKKFMKQRGYTMKQIAPRYYIFRPSKLCLSEASI